MSEGAYDVETAAATDTYLVAGDDVHGAKLATEHLLSLGHRRCAYVGAEGRASSLRRLRGYRLALAEAGLPFDESLVVAPGEGAIHGELAAFRLLARRPAPSALFCYDDMTAVGVLRAVRALNLGVPQDVAVVGFDDIPLAAYLDPPLTTVRQPMYEMGQQAMTMLLDLINGEMPPRLVTMPGELVIRSSSGPPAADRS
jgi:DNA-binding LacI/PurR family transcriptional regulator